jgi:hypothetical protein
MFETNLTAIKFQSEQDLLHCNAEKLNTKTLNYFLLPVLLIILSLLLYKYMYKRNAKIKAQDELKNAKLIIEDKVK